MKSWNVSIETFHETFHDIRQGDCKFMRVKYSKIRMHAHVRIAGRLSMHAGTVLACSSSSTVAAALASQKSALGLFDPAHGARKDTGGDGRQQTFPM